MLGRKYYVPISQWVLTTRTGAARTGTSPCLTALGRLLRSSRLAQGASFSLSIPASPIPGCGTRNGRIFFPMHRLIRADLRGFGNSPARSSTAPTIATCSISSVGLESRTWP